MIWLLACNQLADPALDEPAQLDVWVEETRVTDGPLVLHVEATTSEGWTVEPAIGVPDGLEAELLEKTDTHWTFALSGEPGSYVIPPVVATVTSPGAEVTQLTSENLYVDLLVDGPISDLAPLASLEPPETPAWPFVLLGGLVFPAVIVGVVWWLLREPPPQHVEPVEVVPADVEALTAWARAQDAGLDDHALALEVSRIFRRYVERVTDSPATALTTFELVDRLRDHRDFGRFLVPAKGLLQATDGIKFAREEGSAEMFEQFGQDLRDIVIATRPTPETDAA